MALAAYAKERLAARGLEPLFPEQADVQGVRASTPAAPSRRGRCARRARRGVNPGYPLGRDYPELDGGAARRGDREAHAAPRSTALVGGAGAR